MDQGAPPDFLAPDLSEPASGQDAAVEQGLPGGPRLRVWLVILLVGGAVSLIFGLEEAALLVVLSGLFVAAQAADLYPGQRLLYWALTWTVPFTGAVVFGVFTWLISQMEPEPLQLPMMALSAASALASVLMILRAVSDPATRILFRHEHPNHSLRLSARLIVMGLLLALPGWYVFRGSFEELFGNTQLVDPTTLGTGLPGYILLALASVGFLVRRDWKDTLERLGVRPLRPIDYAIVPIGVVLLIALNVALEAAQRAWFPDLWASDQRVTALIAANLTVFHVLILGLSAGVGEEITLRGALQPRLGIVITSLLFAALHIQYSWFGMLVIFTFGIVLGLIRIRTSTSVAMAVHTLYDVAVVFSI